MMSATWLMLLANLLGRPWAYGTLSLAPSRIRPNRIYRRGWIS